MTKRNKWVASQDYDELVAEVALLRKQQEEMHEMFLEMLLAGNKLRNELCEPEVKDYTAVVYEWDMLINKFE